MKEGGSCGALTRSSKLNEDQSGSNKGPLRERAARNHHPPSHYRGPTLYCHFFWRRSLGPCLHEMEKAMSLTLTFHSPFPTKNVFSGI